MALWMMTSGLGVLSVLSGMPGLGMAGPAYRADLYPVCLSGGSCVPVPACAIRWKAVSYQPCTGVLIVVMTAYKLFQILGGQG